MSEKGLEIVPVITHRCLRVSGSIPQKCNSFSSFLKLQKNCDISSWIRLEVKAIFKFRMSNDESMSYFLTFTVVNFVLVLMITVRVGGFT